MKTSVITLIVTFSIFLSFQKVSSQETKNDTTITYLKSVAHEMIISSPYCALITIDGEGRPRARTMDPFKPDTSFVIWFGTHSKTRKVEQIKNNPKATVYYYNEDVEGYVVLNGSAYLVNDPAEKAKRWKEEWAAFYNQERDTYLLIKFVPQWLEVYSSKHNTPVDPETWRPPVVRFR